MDLRGKFKNFIEDSRLKLLSPGHDGTASADAALPRLVLPPGATRSSVLTDSDLEVSQLLTDPQADQETLELIPPEYFRPVFSSLLFGLRTGGLLSIGDSGGLLSIFLSIFQFRPSW